MKKILGLDIGTNSIGWAIISASVDEQGKETLQKIESAGSRIIPMDGASLNNFNSGTLKSQTAERTQFRGMRRLLERRLLRRERLHRILKVMGFLPRHYADALSRYGKFQKEAECKVAWENDKQGVTHFLFMDSFHEMLHAFHERHPHLKEQAKKIPYDWTLYYLRKKALTHPITKEELAWILLSFNQKRGYYQARYEKEEDENEKRKIKEYRALEILEVEDTGEKKGKSTKYRLTLEGGFVYERNSPIPINDWVGQVRDFIITTEIDEDGSPQKDKDGVIKYSVRMPKEDDWLLKKVKTESEIREAQQPVGAYIFDTLLQDPNKKIRGNWVNTIDRDLYKEEITAILTTQQKFIAELQDRELYLRCCEELYPSNEAHRHILEQKGFTELLRDDVLFYQRPLKSKKSLIAECPFEERCYVDSTSGEVKRVGIKCIPKSHPLFQEFRLWQFISNLRIYQREKRINGKLHLDANVTEEFLKDEKDYANLFKELSDKKSINQSGLLSLLGLKEPKKLKANEKDRNIELYRWNYVEDKTHPCNETHAQIVSYLKKAKIPTTVLTSEMELALWHILYSVSDQKELRAALEHFAQKFALGANFAETFEKFPTFDSGYASYSEKAIKKLLPLMRQGAYWSENDIDPMTKSRIEKIIAGEYDERIQERVRENTKNLKSISDFQGLPLWLASYVVYDRHSEAKEITKWHSPEDIDRYLQEFKQYSLRNPVVEQIILETLRTVRDIWKQEGHIDEIHVELGREMKNSKEQRIKILNQINENENANLRIKALLQEFMNKDYKIDNIRPHSPSQQETLRIYEDTTLHKFDKLPDDIITILKKFNEHDQAKRPTHSDFIRYKLWLEQNYFSPYTGAVIPLAKLFTEAYEVDHIIPRKRFYDDSISNKVICEAAVNKDKSAMLGYEYIQQRHGSKIDLGGGQIVEILSVEKYEKMVSENYNSARSRRKMKNLLMEDVPEDFTNRQLNDTRYISKFIKKVLSNIVRADGEQEETSKNIITCNGNITDRLKNDWGLNDVWNHLILPRFERLEEKCDGTKYTAITKEGHKIPAMPLELQKGFNKKRIDHRHHAMDALAIACANRNIVNYLNNSNAATDKGKLRFDLQAKICTHKQIIDKPWQTFTQDAAEVLNNIVVTFKHRQRIITKAVNSYEHFDQNGKKVMIKQTKGDHWAIRKPLHKATYYGEINLRQTKEVTLKVALQNPQSIVNKEFKRLLQRLLAKGWNEKQIKKHIEENHDVWQDINPKRIKVYYFTKDTEDRYFSSRKLLDSSFNKKKIEDIADNGIKKILLRHLEENDEDPQAAFSPEGIERLNENIERLNNNKPHQPIHKVRIYEKANKFAVGGYGNKKAQFVEAEKGTNLFFAIYRTETVDKKTQEIIVGRTFDSIPLSEAIERMKNKLSPVPQNEEGRDPLFVLSPNDLVYLPTAHERAQGIVNYPLDHSRIYKMVSATEKVCYFIPFNVAHAIVNKVEFESNNKIGRALTGEIIKEYCVPIHFDRLGNLTEEVKII